MARVRVQPKEKTLSARRRPTAAEKRVHGAPPLGETTRWAAAMSERPAGARAPEESTRLVQGFPGELSPPHTRVHIPDEEKPPHTRVHIPGEAAITTPGRPHQPVHRPPIFHVLAMAPVPPPSRRVRGQAAEHTARPVGAEAPDTGVPPVAAVVRGSAADLAEAVGARARPSARMSAAWPQLKRSQPARSPFPRRSW
jgi:hypothetical protein